jgi:glycosyltransferase involved in cell wall biosynthesis
MPAVSILTAAYNAAAFIERTIDTVLQQTCRDFEWIVVDDGSTDRTAELVAGVADSRVRLIRRANGGPSAARNTGLEVVTADLVALLDHDDIWAPNRLERLLEVFDDGAVGIASSNMLVGDPAAPEQARTILDNPSCPDPDLADAAMWIQGCGFSASTAVIRTDLLRSHGGWREDLWYAQDWELALRLWLRGVRVVMLPEQLGWTVMREGQLGANPWGFFADRRAVLRELAADSTRPEIARVAASRLRFWQREQALVGVGEALARLDDDPKGARDRFRWALRYGLPAREAAVALAGSISPRALAYVRRRKR